MNLISATPQLFGKIRRFPRSVRDEYRRGPDSFANLSFYAFGLSAVWIPVNTVLLQFRVLDIADEDQKNGMLGAIAVYPAGKISDRFGRMRVLYGSSFVIAVAAGLLLFVNTIVPLVGLGLFIGIRAAMFLQWRVSVDHRARAAKKRRAVSRADRFFDPGRYRTRTAIRIWHRCREQTIRESWV